MLIDLTRDEYEQLLIVLGMAMGTFIYHGDKPAAYRVLALTNVIGRASPTFIPYQIPPDPSD